MTRKEIDRLRVLLSKTRDTLIGIGRGEPTDLFALVQNVLAIEGALLVTDPDRPRETTPLGVRILEAASDVGLDTYRLQRILKPVLPAGALTRLLHHEVRQVDRGVLERVASTIGCQLEWLMTGKGDRRRAPPAPGLAMARIFGASEDAIAAVQSRDATVTDRDEFGWMTAFLEETRRRARSGPPSSSARRK